MGILKDLEFYYQLKVLNEEGYFKKGNITPQIQQHYKLSQSSIWRKIRRLLNLGLIRKGKSGYRLVRYDTLFTVLGYDLSFNYKRNRIGNFKIFKVDLNKIDHWILYIAKEEIDLNFDRQAFRIWKKIRKDNHFKQLLRKERTQLHSLRDIRSFIERLYNQTDKVDHLKEVEFSKNIQRYIDLTAKDSSTDKIPINLDITLSNWGISKLLGYKTTLKGFQIQKLLNKMNLIKSQKREVYLGTTSLTLNEFRKKYKDPLFRLDGSSIYRVLPNKIVVL